MNCSMCLVGKGLGYLAMAAVASVGGYNLVTTGCVTGLCSSGSANTSLSPAVSTQIGGTRVTEAALMTGMASANAGAGQVEHHECILDEAGTCQQCVLEAEAEAQALEESAETITETVPADG